MSSETHLDNRLQLCAAYVRRGMRVADIGTDHAYLPVWLCRNGICPSAIAADVKPEPLARGKMTIAAAHMQDRVQARLSDGLQAIGEDETDDIVMAGMGGELMAHIIGACPYAKNPQKHFVLQPMTKSEVLLRWLCDNGFAVQAQDCCVAGGKCYTVLSVVYTGQTAAADDLFPYTGRLRPYENETHRRFVQGHIDRLRKQAMGDARYGVLADRLEEYCDNGTGYFGLV